MPGITCVIINVKLPWWWRLYLHALVFSQACGVLLIDVEVAARFIVDHAKISAKCR
jgi:hypothetical protein